MSLHAYKSPSLLSKPVSPEALERAGDCIAIYLLHSFGICGKKKSPQHFVGLSFFCLAVRTRLELATPCVTGMYSNQTELPDHSHYRLYKNSLCFSNAVAKVRLFFDSTNKKFFFFQYYLLCPENQVLKNLIFFFRLLEAPQNYLQILQNLCFFGLFLLKVHFCNPNLHGCVDYQIFVSFV